MKAERRNLIRIAVLLGALVLLSVFSSTDVFAQRVRGGQAQTHLMSLPPNHTRLFVGGHPYFYHNGSFYRGWRRGGYVRYYPPIGARFRFLPYGFWSFNIGPALYYYGGGVYFQYVPDENAYVVVPKPSQAPATPGSDEDIMYMTDGTSLSGVFVGATADSIRFQVKNEVQTFPITKVKSINFAPSSFKEQK